jgi:hypothetical protein
LPSFFSVLTTSADQERGISESGAIERLAARLDHELPLARRKVRGLAVRAEENDTHASLREAHDLRSKRGSVDALVGAEGGRERHSDAVGPKLGGVGHGHCGNV